MWIATKVSDVEFTLAPMITAEKPLYAALTPEQRQIADAMFARQGKCGGAQGHHRHGHRGHHGA